MAAVSGRGPFGIRVPVSSALARTSAVLVAAIAPVAIVMVAAGALVHHVLATPDRSEIRARGRDRDEVGG